MRGADTNLLLAAILVLGAGPLLYQLARYTRLALAVLDGFIFAAIGGLVLVHVIPESFHLGGWAAIPVGLVGLLAPGLLERWVHGKARQVHAAALFLGLLGLALHTFMDGMALGGAGHEGDLHQHGALPLAVLLHRLPEGLVIWFLVRPVYGMRMALGTLAGFAVATAAGFAFGGLFLDSVENQGRGIFQALVAGALMHVLVHRSYPMGEPAGTRTGPLAAGVGALGGMALVWAVTRIHGLVPELAAAPGVFRLLAVESAPALLLAYVAAGLVYGFLPQSSLRWMSRGNRLSQALRGMVVGLPLPICSCGVVPLYRTLVLQGVPASAALAFLVATPELSLDAVLISFPLLGGEFTAVRLASAALVALVVGLALGRMLPPLGHLEPAPAGYPDGHGEGRWARVRDGLRETVDSTAPWILVGLAVAALVEPLLREQWLDYIPAWLEVAFFALLGLPTYVCASGATPLVAVLIHKGVSPGAALAFLLTGPATNITTFGVLSRLHGHRVALAFGGVVAVVTVALGHLVNRYVTAPAGLRMDQVPSEAGVGFGMLCLWAVAGLYLVSLLRRGPRAFVGELYAVENVEEAERECAHQH